MSEVSYKVESEGRVVFREFSSVGEAEVFKSLLDSAGIWSMINNEYMSMIYPMAISAQLIIAKDDIERVNALISDL